MKKVILWILLIGVFAGAGIYLYVFYFGARHKDPLKSSSMISVHAADLFDLYENDEDSANSLYLGKVIRVSGKISALDLKDSRYSVYFQTRGSMGSVLCEMDSVENTKVAQLRAGDSVNIAGFCNGINLDVYLDRCKLAE